MLATFTQGFTISIHTTTQVVTKEYINCSRPLPISIHTTTQVVTGHPPALVLLSIDFNPHHHAGGDVQQPTEPTQPAHFNPHHHAGGDGCGTLHREKESNFNPHHHAGGDV